MKNITYLTWLIISSLRCTPVIISKYENLGEMAHNERAICTIKRRSDFFAQLKTENSSNTWNLEVVSKF